MTLTIVFGIFILIGIGLCASQRKYIARKSTGVSTLPINLGVFLVVLFGFAFILNLFVWTVSRKDSEIEYHQLLVERATIQAMLQADCNVDRLEVSNAVITYNNKIIRKKINSNRFIYGEYYSKHCDWNLLELIQ